MSSRLAAKSGAAKFRPVKPQPKRPSTAAATAPSASSTAAASPSPSPGSGPSQTSAPAPAPEAPPSSSALHDSQARTSDATPTISTAIVASEQAPPTQAQNDAPPRISSSRGASVVPVDPSTLPSIPAQPSTAPEQATNAASTSLTKPADDAAHRSRSPTVLSQRPTANAKAVTTEPPAPAAKSASTSSVDTSTKGKQVIPAVLADVPSPQQGATSTQEAVKTAQQSTQPAPQPQVQSPEPSSVSTDKTANAEPEAVSADPRLRRRSPRKQVAQAVSNDDGILDYIASILPRTEEAGPITQDSSASTSATGQVSTQSVDTNQAGGNISAATFKEPQPPTPRPESSNAPAFSPDELAAIHQTLPPMPDASPGSSSALISTDGVLDLPVPQNFADVAAEQTADGAEQDETAGGAVATTTKKGAKGKAIKSRGTGRPRGRPRGSKTKKAPSTRKNKATQDDEDGDVAVNSEVDALNTAAAAADGNSEDDAEESAVSESASGSGKRKRKAPVKPKKKATKKPKKKKRKVGEDGEDGSDAEDTDDGHVYSSDPEDGQPWVIDKRMPGYTINTKDIFATLGLAEPVKLRFCTAQDIRYEPGSDAEDEAHEANEINDNQASTSKESPARPASSTPFPPLPPLPPLPNRPSGYSSSSIAPSATFEYDSPPASTPRYQDEDMDSEDGSAFNRHTEPNPFGPVDPTRTTMKSLATDSGRGRLSQSVREKLQSKVKGKARLKMARERMKLQAALEKSGLDPQAIKQRLDEEMERIFLEGGVLEFDMQDLASTNGSAVAPRRGADEREDSVDSTLRGNQPLFRRDSDDEDGNENPDDQDGEDKDGDEGMMESQYAPQMRLVNGVLVVDESSTQVVMGNGAREAFTVVEEHAQSRKVNYGSWMRRGSNGRWTMADTNLFYDGLAQFGTDFELLSRMFSDRTRKQIKAKFRKEEKNDPMRVDAALMGKKDVNVGFYEQINKLDFTSGATPADPMAKFYEGLPTVEGTNQLESNRDPSPSEELDLAALLRKKKEETVGLQLEHGRPVDAMPEIQEEGDSYQDEDAGEQEMAEDDNDEQMHGDNDGEQGDSPRQLSRSASPPEEEPFSFAGAVQLRVSG